MLTSLIYHFENKVNHLDNEIVSKIELIKKHENDMVVLEAEWSYQNNPKRLVALNKNVNQNNDVMDNPSVKQFTKISDLGTRRTYISRNER